MEFSPRTKSIVPRRYLCTSRQEHRKTRFRKKVREFLSSKTKECWEMETGIRHSMIPQKDWKVPHIEGATTGSLVTTLIIISEGMSMEKNLEVLGSKLGRGLLRIKVGL